MSPLLRDIVALGRHGEASDLTYVWSGLAGIASCLSSNIHMKFGNSLLYPNMYIMLVGTAGKRKSTPIKEIKKRCKEVGTLGICGDKVILQKYLDDLADSHKSMDWQSVSFDSSGTTPSFICQDEFGDFIGINNYPFITLLGSLWDTNDAYQYRTKSGTELAIPTPIVNILGATTPSQFNTIFPPSVSEQGFLSRLIIINVPENKQKVSFPLPSPPEVIERVNTNLAKLMQHSGEITLSEEAMIVQDEIYKSWNPIEDARFAHYATRRHTQLLKLVMNITASRFSLEVSTEDLVFANTLLSYAEHKMPNALGHFGKQRDSDVSNKILDILHRIHPKAIDLNKLYSIVATDVGASECFKLIQSLIVAGKAIQTKDGIYATKRSHISITTKHIDWSLLDGLMTE